MPVNGLEAVADAIQKFEGWDPGTRSYVNRNPGNLRLPGLPADDKGYTIFPDYVSGYNALLRDLAAKFSGHNTHGLGPASTLITLMNVYAPPSDNNPTEAYADFVAKWVGMAIGKPVGLQSELCNIWSPATPAAPAASPTLDASDQ